MTGEDPPDAPPPPVLRGYGLVTLDEGALLLEELGAFVPGDGIAVDRPDIMEEYGQSCAALPAQHVVHVIDTWSPGISLCNECTSSGGDIRVGA